MTAATGCTCTDYCPEDGGGCDWCARNLDSCDPCPTIGFGCGTGGNDTRCDCCTDEQWIAAGGNPAVVMLDHGITS